MTARKLLISFFLGLFAMAASTANAQTWSKEQTAVWTVIIASYDDIDARNVDWSDKWVFADAVVWGPDNPMPRTRDSVKRWDAYSFPAGKNHVSEYSPAAIVVHDSTAVAHYYYSNATEDREGKHTTTHGRCTDVLAKDGKSWKFIAWHCGDEPSDD